MKEQKRIIIEEKIKTLQEWDKKTRMEKIKILKQTYNTSQEREGESSARGYKTERTPYPLNPLRMRKG